VSLPQKPTKSIAGNKLLKYQHFMGSSQSNYCAQWWFCSNRYVD